MNRTLRRVLLTAVGLVVLGIAGLVGVLRSKCSASSAVEPVAPNVYHVRNFLADIYGMRVGSQVLLFDAGMDPKGHAIDDLLHTLDAKREDVTLVFLTHAHSDHVAGAGLFPKAQVHLGSADLDVLAQREPMQPLTPRLFGALIGGAPHRANSPLRGRERIDIGSGRSVLALPFPGHTPGSFLYLFEGVLFTGDSLLLEHGQLTHAVSGHSVNPSENQANVRGLRRLLGGEPVDTICTGHMGCTPRGAGPKLLAQLH